MVDIRSPLGENDVQPYPLGGPTMHLHCPHCRNPIEVVELRPREEVVCPSCGSSFQLREGSTPPFTDVREIGRFEIVESIGIGTFGSVYKARDPELQRIVAIKVPRAGNLSSTDDLERFLREGRSVAQLRHPSIVSVHEVGQHDEVPFLVSDFIEGVTLADLLTSRRLGFREAAELIAQLADALQYAHDMGVVHRDVKPSNVMLETVVSGQGSVVSDQNAGLSDRKPSAAPHSPTTDHRPLTTVRLMDFGLAKRDAGEITMTIDGQVLGTPAYMSPEQARGDAHKVDGRSDVYSLGVIFYELLTGELPFRGNSRMLLHQVLHDDPRPPRKLNDRIPRDLETICLKAMAKEPSRRYPSARELADDLRRWLKDEPIQARPVGRMERARRWCRRNPLAATFMLSLVLSTATAISLVIWAFLEKERADENAAREEIAKDEAINQRRLTEQKAQAEAKAKASRDWYRQYLNNDLTRRLTVVLAKGYLTDEDKQFLSEARNSFEQFAAETEQDEPTKASVAWAHYQLANIHVALQDVATACAANRCAAELFQQLADEFPKATEYRIELARNQRTLASLLKADGRESEAEAELHAAIVVLKQLTQASSNAEHHRQLAECHLELARLLETDDAEKEFRAALTIAQKFQEQFPGVSHYSQLAHDCHYGLYEILKSAGRVAEAEVEAKAALAARQSCPGRIAIPDFPIPDFQSPGQVDIPHFPPPPLPVAYYRNHLAVTMLNIAYMYRYEEQYRVARQWLEKAKPHHQEVLKADPDNDHFRRTYRNNRRCYVEVLIALADHKAASEAAEEYAQATIIAVVDVYHAAASLAQCIRLAGKDEKLDEAARKELVQQYANRAMKLLQLAVKNGFKDVERLKKEPAFAPLREREDFKKLVEELKRG